MYLTITLTSFCSSKSSLQGFRLECCDFDANSVPSHHLRALNYGNSEPRLTNPTFDMSHIVWGVRYYPVLTC